jgi:hypothetical protein
MGTIRLCVLVVLLAAGLARAGNCPDQRASCVLHEEGVTLFLEGKHQLAAAKFAAALAAEPTARSYLGYAQAVEALGQIALAYDTLVKAQVMSQAEVKAGANADVNARAERIKYKLGELRAKIGFAWLRVPPGVQQQRVVAVQREGETQLAAPFSQWIAVTPDKQVLIATIDDGTQLTVVAQVAAGSQGVVVIPVAASARPPVPVRPGVPPGQPIEFPAPRPKPFYKKWWFWTIVIVGVLVIISARSSGSDETVSSFRFDRPVPPPPPGGVTLFRF